MSKDTKTPEAPAKKKAEEGPKMVTSRMLADKIGCKPAALRRYLRSLPSFQDKTYTRYKWPEGDKQLAQIEAGYAKFKESEKEKNAKRLAAIKDKGGKKGKTKEDEGGEEEDEL